MKPITVIFIVLASAAACAAVAPANDYTALERKVLDSLTGAWRHFDIQYRFGSEDELTAMQMRNGSRVEKKFAYRMITSDSHAFLQCEPADGGEPVLLLKGDVSDSTAVLALGTVFVRADSGDGLAGTWERSNELAVTRLTFSERAVEFAATQLDIGTGEMVTMESRHGGFAFTGGKRGQISVTFDSGEIVDMVPLVAGDIMYLFDLSPRKSLFVRQPPPMGEGALVDNSAGRKKTVPE